MFVKAIHPRHAHQIWEIPDGAAIRYGVITPPVGEHDQSTSDWSWAPLLAQYDVSTAELHVHGDPDVYTDGPQAPPGWALYDDRRDQTATKHYFVKFVSWNDIAVITGSEGDLFIMGDGGKTIDKVG